MSERFIGYLMLIAFFGIVALIFSTGILNEKREFCVDAYGNSIIGTEHTVTDVHWPKWVGEDGGLPYFFAFLWFCNLFFFISSMWNVLWGERGDYVSLAWVSGIAFFLLMFLCLLTS